MKRLFVTMKDENGKGRNLGSNEFIEFDVFTKVEGHSIKQGSFKLMVNSKGKIDFEEYEEVK